MSLCHQHCSLTPKPQQAQLQALVSCSLSYPNFRWTFAGYRCCHSTLHSSPAGQVEQTRLTRPSNQSLSFVPSWLDSSPLLAFLHCDLRSDLKTSTVPLEHCKLWHESPSMSCWYHALYIKITFDAYAPESHKRKLTSCTRLRITSCADVLPRPAIGSSEGFARGMGNNG